MIGGRHLTALLLLLGLALVPTILHGYLGFVGTAAPVLAENLPPGSRPAESRRSAAWLTETYAVESWAERAYDLPGHRPVTLFVARGFDLKKLYHHPELGVLRGRSFHPHRSALIDGQPVHVLRNLTGAESAVYALVYEDRWIGNPYVLQVSSAVTALWTGRRPLTLVFAYGDVLRGEQPSPEVAQLLRDSVSRLR